MWIIRGVSNDLKGMEVLFVSDDAVVLIRSLR